MTTFEYITTIISTLALIFTALSVRFIWLQMKKTNEWNRRKCSQELLINLTSGKFSEIFRKVRELNSEKNKYEIQDKNKNYLELYENLNQKEQIEFISDVLFLLNIMESICISIKNNIIDEDITYNMLYNHFITFFRWVEPYIRKRRMVENNDCVFAELEAFVVKWEKRLEDEKSEGIKNKSHIVKPKEKL